MQGCAAVDPRHNVVVGVVEAVHPDHAGLGIQVALIRVGGIQVVLEHSQPVQVLDLRTTRRKSPPSVTAATAHARLVRQRTDMIKLVPEQWNNPPIWQKKTNKEARGHFRR